MQTLTISGSGLSGTFTLTFNGATTGPIPYSSNDIVLQANIEHALSALPTIGYGNVAVSTTTTAGVFTVAFQNNLGASSQTDLAIDITGLVGSASTSISNSAGSLLGVTGGASVTYTVTAEDQFGNVATGYTGTVHAQHH